MNEKEPPRERGAIDDASPGGVIDLGPAEERARSFALDKHREETRGRVAMWLLWLLIGVVAAAFITVWINMWQTRGAPGEAVRTEVRDLLQLVLGPVITLLGTVTGFYFGAQGRRTSAKRGR